MSLFDDPDPPAAPPDSSAPLAERMRPRTLDEFIGQDALIAPGRPLREAIDNDRLLLIGRSAQASALVARMEGAPQWRSPALTGTLQPDARSGRDRFTLAADLAVAPATSGGADAGRH